MGVDVEDVENLPVLVEVPDVVDTPARDDLRRNVGDVLPIPIPRLRVPEELDHRLRLDLLVDLPEEGNHLTE